MATDTATSHVKFHISLNVADLAKSVAFYRLLFGEPAKLRPDYAKFECDDPQLVLSLEPGPKTPGGSLNHLGLRLADSAALVDVQRRFELAGIKTNREDGVECCYALQTKFWVLDPDRNLWELYLLHEDLEHRGLGQTLDEMLPGGESPPEEETTPTIWEHTLGQDIPHPLPHVDASLEEVRLLGTFNAVLVEPVRERLLAEALRVLKPGGNVFLHTLVGDRALDARPSLPGPAAMVEAVPVDWDLLAGVERAGFVYAHWEKYADLPCFSYNGVAMRESKLRGYKPQPTTARDHFVLYKGPLKQVTDDTGNAYPRGQRVAADAGAWSALQASPAADQFVFFAADTVVTSIGKACQK